MSDQDTTPQMPSDAELFKSAMSDASPAPAPASEAPPAPAETPAAAEPSGDTPRDPATGRFMPKTPDQATPAPVAATAPQPDPAATPPVPEDEAAMVPTWRLRELREERDAARAQAQQREQYERAYHQLMQQRQMEEAQRQAAQEPAQIPDMIADPQGYHQFVMHSIQEERSKAAAEVSFRFAHNQHGELFEHAYGTMLQRAQQGDPSIVRAVMASPDPGAAMVNWYRREQTLSQVGDDPNAWFDQELDRRLKDQKYAGSIVEKVRGNVAPTNGGTAPVQLPPSLNRMAASAPNRPTTGDMSNDSLFQHAFREGRR